MFIQSLQVFLIFKRLHTVNTVFYLFNIAKNAIVYGYCNLDWVVFINQFSVQSQYGLMNCALCFI